MKGMTVPKQLILGQSATLECNYNLENSKLYSVKWYKDGQEFFRWMPSMENKREVFPVRGVQVDRWGSSSLHVKLSHISLNSSGIYRCEVSNEFPDFDTVTTAEILSVVAIPSGPRISPRPTSGAPGDRMNLSCVVKGSLPQPTLTWYINKTPVPLSRSSLLQRLPGLSPVSVVTYSNNSDMTMDVVLTLLFSVQPHHFIERKLDIKCSAILGDFFMKSDNLVLEDTRRTNVRMVKSGNVAKGTEKTLSLFDDDSYREEEVFLSRSNSVATPFLLCSQSSLFIFAPIWTLLLKFLSVW